MIVLYNVHTIAHIHTSTHHFVCTLCKHKENNVHIKCWSQIYLFKWLRIVYSFHKEEEKYMCAMCVMCVYDKMIFNIVENQLLSQKFCA